MYLGQRSPLATVPGTNVSTPNLWVCGSNKDCGLKICIWVNFFCCKIFLMYWKTIVTTPTQLKSWVWHENDFTPPITTTIHHPPPPTTQCQQYQSYFWPDFKQTLKVGFQDQQQHEQQQQQHHQKQKQQICLRSTQSSWVKNNLGLGNLKSPKRIHIKIVLGSKILMSNNFCFDFHYIWVRYWWDICKKNKEASFWILAFYCA